MKSMKSFDKEAVRQALTYLMERFRGFNRRDVGVFKLCLISLGVLIGLYARKACRDFSPLIWIVFLGSYAYLIYRLLIAPVLYPTED